MKNPNTPRESHPIPQTKHTAALPTCRHPIEKDKETAALYKSLEEL